MSDLLVGPPLAMKSRAAQGKLQGACGPLMLQNLAHVIHFLLTDIPWRGSSPASPAALSTVIREIWAPGGLHEPHVSGTDWLCWVGLLLNPGTSPSGKFVAFFEFVIWHIAVSRHAIEALPPLLYLTA